MSDHYSDPIDVSTSEDASDSGDGNADAMAAVALITILFIAMTWWLSSL